MRRHSLSPVALVLFLITASASRAQQADSTVQALQELGTWLTETLPKVGEFSINVTGDWANVGAFRSSSGTNRSVEAKHRIDLVAVANCELRYRLEFTVRGGVPEILDVVVPVGSLDVSLMQIRRYELPHQLRATNPRWEVYLRAASSSKGFTVTDRDQRTINIWEHSIPVDRSNNAEQVADRLRRAARLCGAT